MKNIFHLTQVPFFHALMTKIQDGDTNFAVNSCYVKNHNDCVTMNIDLVKV